MLWLCLHCPQLPLEAVLSKPDEPWAVLSNQQRVLVANESAAAFGVAGGQRLGHALTLCPGLKATPRRKADEVGLIETVATWAYQFGSPVTLDASRCFVWVEVGQSLKLFGGIRELLKRVTTEADDLSVSIQRGIAPTLESAALFARTGLRKPVMTLGRLHEVLMLLPLSALDWPAAQAKVLHGAGFRTLKEIFDLPPDALARRFGPDLPLFLSRLSGRAPDAWSSYKPPETFRRRFPFLNEIEHIEGVLFPLRRVVSELAAFLRGRDAGVQSFEIRLTHPDKRISTRSVSLLSSTQNADQLFRLAKERLEREPPDEAVVELLVVAEQLLALELRQQSLFDDGSINSRRQDLLERLIARLGDDGVEVVQPCADHRPEKAVRRLSVLRAAKEKSSVSALLSPRSFLPRPPWLLDTPKPIAAPKLLSGPERIETGWQEVDVRRDYFVAEDREGLRLWVYRTPDSPQWFLHGLWQ